LLSESQNGSVPISDEQDTLLRPWRSAFEFTAARCVRDHAPVADSEPASELSSLFESLPLHGALILPAHLLRQRIRVRAAKDRRLKGIIRQVASGPERIVIVNHCCVFARHARQLAHELQHAFVVAADIDPLWHNLYSLSEALQLRATPANYRFIEENIYQSWLQCRPHALCVFGGCGSLLDAAIDVALRLRAPHLVLRACCHENIGMNTQLSTRAFTLWNLGHRLKNIAYRYYHRAHGFYGDTRYGPDAYPRSRTARAILRPHDFLRPAQHSVDCWLCRMLIDLDRSLFMIENGYCVRGYLEGMFVAVRRDWLCSTSMVATADTPDRPSPGSDDGGRGSVS
jgi:hypothetical protein